MHIALLTLSLFLAQHLKNPGIAITYKLSIAALTYIYTIAIGNSSGLINIWMLLFIYYKYLTFQTAIIFPTNSSLLEIH
jgi:hypothetical protein